ncbi:MAG: T9SS type A sorting domain-containing protein [Candidatus Kapabacteria bacterium]|nr:T9SS type A sorting domain-containing protein [Ignavibacteriota bacterium]MCW5883935.1 T9SS type A sorting domain-containing protein [Candidatus Kapabacteria bacterium]
MKAKLSIVESFNKVLNKRYYGIRAMYFLVIITLLLPLQKVDIFSYGDSPYCNDYICPEIEFVYQGIEPLPDLLYPACKYDVHWSYRFVDCPEAGMSWCDFRIDSIVGSLENGPACEGNRTVYELVREMTFLLLEKKVPFTSCFAGLSNSSCTTNISVSYASCWQYEIDPYTGGGNLKKLVPCKNLTQCCREVWQICKDATGQLHPPPTHVSTLGINPICPIDEQNPEDACFAVCENPSLKQTINNQETYLSGYGDKLVVFPNPANDILNLNFVSDAKGIYSVEVYDIAGNLVLIESFSISQLDKDIQLDIHKLTSGTYAFMIKHNDMVRISGNFGIVK